MVWRTLTKKRFLWINNKKGASFESFVIKFLFQMQYLQTRYSKKIIGREFHDFIEFIADNQNTFIEYDKISSHNHPRILNVDEAVKKQLPDAILTLIAEYESKYSHQKPMQKFFSDIVADEQQHALCQTVNPKFSILIESLHRNILSKKQKTIPMVEAPVGLFSKPKMSPVAEMKDRGAELIEKLNVFISKNKNKGAKGDAALFSQNSLTVNVAKNIIKLMQGEDIVLDWPTKYLDSLIPIMSILQEYLNELIPILPIALTQRVFDERVIVKTSLLTAGS